MQRTIKRLSIAIGMGVSGSLLAVASPAEAEQSEAALTPWGAEVAGNADGSIPAYSGGIQPPASYDPGKPGVRPDPFAGEAPLQVIDAGNYREHADKLSAGTVALFERYPGFSMQVYPSHRTARYPQYQLERMQRNAEGCRLANEGLRLQNCWAAIPFPRPTEGIQVMWNRVFKYENYVFKADDLMTTVVDSRGNKTDTSGWAHSAQYPLFDPALNRPMAGDEVYEMHRGDYYAPARKFGEKMLLRDSIDMQNVGRKAWTYLPGQRRVKLAPDIGYDTPTLTGAGIGTMDDSYLFYGPMDRFDFKLVGKREIYIPYNTFKLQDASLCGRDQVLTPNHLAPDCVRWELHRVWVVEGTLKPGMRHLYSRRTLYFDEDLWGAGVAESYDAAGAIYRVVMSLPFPLYESDGHISSEFVTHDLAAGSYVRQAYSTNEKGGWQVVAPRPERFYTPAALSASGIR